MSNLIVSEQDKRCRNSENKIIPSSKLCTYFCNIRYLPTILHMSFYFVKKKYICLRTHSKSCIRNLSFLYMNTNSSDSYYVKKVKNYRIFMYKTISQYIGKSRTKNIFGQKEASTDLNSSNKFDIFHPI